MQKAGEDNHRPLGPGQAVLAVYPLPRSSGWGLEEGRVVVGLGHSQADLTLILSQRPVRVCSLDSWISCLWHPAPLHTNS